MTDDIPESEFTFLGGIELTRDDMCHVEQDISPLPSFSTEPASGFESERLPMKVQPRVAEERLNQIYTGFDGRTLPEECGALSDGYLSRTSRPIYVPEHFPYTYTHIDELGEWPQRLLHVPSMTSYEWQPGNVYGGCRDPKYRAISYTWGRWRIRSGQKPKVKTAVQIEGVPWQIPRIDPDHFSSTQLEHIIKQACKFATESFPSVEFVWLDLACIDQRWGPLAAMEVGRQAGIFRNATGVAIWLCQSGKDAASFERICKLFTSLMSFQVDNTELIKVACDPAQLKQIIMGVRELLCDPWFTSLWTLQEAYLSENAVFFSAGAELFCPVVPLRNNEYSLFTLHDTALQCRVLSTHCLGASKKQCEQREFIRLANELESWVSMSGLCAMGTNDGLLALLSSARYRRTSRDQDHIYGIMQVFGYRLGTSNPAANPEISYTRPELTDQLGAALFEDRPLQSQLHVFTEPVERGKGWHLSLSSTSVIQKFPLIPVPSDTKRQSSKHWPRCACVFSTRRLEEKVFGHFHGRVCWFSTLSRIWGMVDAFPVEAKLSHQNICRFFPDVSEHIRDSVEYLVFTAVEIPDLPGRHHAFAQYLQEKFTNNRLVVLFLGSMMAQYYGMILLHVQVGTVFYWHRLGTCVWIYDVSIPDLPDEPPDWRDLMEGGVGSWVEMDGIFG